jgi:hypothetical protein
VTHSKGSANTGVDRVLLLFTGHMLLEVFGGKLRMLQPALYFVVPGLLAVTALWSLFVVLILIKPLFPERCCKFPVPLILSRN